MVIITSTFLGLVTNYFNPKGIPLIRTQKLIKFAPDSLFIQSENSNLESSSSDKIDQAENELENESVKNTTTKQTNKESENFKQKEIVKNSEVVAFEEPRAIKLEQAYSLYNKGILFIDARDEGDFDAGHIKNSVNIPFDDFDNHKQKLDKISKEIPMVIYCAGKECDLSHLMANLLFEKGYKQVYVFFGGWVEWQDAKYPTQKTLGNN